MGRAGGISHPPFPLGKAQWLRGTIGWNRSFLDVPGEKQFLFILLVDGQQPISASPRALTRFINSVTVQRKLAFRRAETGHTNHDFR